MPTRQRVILLVLMFLSLLQQGVRWKTNEQGAHGQWETAVITGTAEAAEVQSGEQSQRHCPLVHVNTAGMAELQTLPGIGPVYAERIIIERKEQPFKEKHELLRISGIGEKRLAEIVPLICLYYDENTDTE